jgi:hypothetical protein
VLDEGKTIILRTASLVAGSETPAGDGITGALRCVLLLDDQSKRAAILKRGPIGEVAAEAFCALLLRAWELPVPEPFLINEGAAVSFASADIGYPNLKQALGVSGIPPGPGLDAAILTASALACSLRTSPLAAACDEAIDNRDRNLGNILWNGESESWIDHAGCVGMGTRLPDVNKLCLMAVGSPSCDRIKKGSIAQALLLGRNTPKQAQKALETTPLKGQDMASLVAERLSSLGTRLIGRFPSPVDLFSDL